jgi:hypothetical protein
VFRDVRNFDVSMVLTRDSAPEPNLIRELRERLWMEHLGMRAFEAMDPGTLAQLSRWKTLASRNVTRLNGLAQAEPFLRGGSFVLQYSTSPTPRGQLADAGVESAAALRLRFDPGWLEVHCSPNWIRNMFL